MSKLLNCLVKKNKSDVPVWFMRQAGRYLPEFREIRKKNTNFVELCLNEELSEIITLQPLDRFKFDAAIIFSDILMIPFGMGQKVEFQKNFGPKLGEINKEEMFNLKETYFSDKLQPIYK